MSQTCERNILEDINEFARKMSMIIRENDGTILSQDEIITKLASLHCPFTWKPFNDASYRDTMSKTENKLSNVEDEGEGFTAWTTFVLTLILCYEYAKKGMIEYALKKQEECQKIVERDFFVPVMGIGLKHVCDACKIFLLMKSEQMKEAADALRVITDITDMEKKHQASVWSVRGALFLEYGLKGMKESIPFIEKALQLDSQSGEWNFLLGKALSRVRRIEARTRSPEERELNALEHAVGVSNNSFYMVVLAQSYVDKARLVTTEKRGSSYFKSLCDEMNEKAVQLYRGAYENCRDNPYVLGRCAYGLMRLPPPWRDMKHARKCVESFLARPFSSDFLNNVAAELYERQNELDKAKYYYALSAENGCFCASIRLLKLRGRKNESYDPIPDLEKYIELFKEKPHQEHLYALLGAYHFFVKNDFNVALNYWSKVIESDINSIELRSIELWILKNAWPRTPQRCDISKTIVTEILRRLEGCSDDERRIYKKVLDQYKKDHCLLVLSIQERPTSLTRNEWRQRSTNSQKYNFS